MNYGKLYWLRLKKDFFKRHDVYILESMENGREMVLLYIKMLVESIDHEGCLRFNEEIPYTAEMLAAIFHTDLNIIKFALEKLTLLEMIKIEDDGTIKMLKFSDFVGSETPAAEKKRKQRNLPTLVNGSKRLNGSTLITPDGKAHNVDEKRYGGHGMQALDRAYGRCEVCGSDEYIVIHHNNGYSTELDDLVCLCVPCHGKAHNNKNKGHIKIKRPPYVHRLSTESLSDVGQMSIQSIENRDKSIEIRDKSIDFFSNEKNADFTPPTIEELYEYCESRHNGINPQNFYDYYSAKGWCIGSGGQMKDWRAAIRAWENNQNKFKGDEI